MSKIDKAISKRLDTLIYDLMVKDDLNAREAANKIGGLDEFDDRELGYLIISGLQKAYELNKNSHKEDFFKKNDSYKSLLIPYFINEEELETTIKQSKINYD